MNQDRNLGVTEARLGLTLLTCLLVALGYVILQRLGGTGEAPIVESRPGSVSQPATFTGKAAPSGDDQPRVLVTEGTESPAVSVPQTSQRPDEPAHGSNDPTRREL